jgi:type IV secretory pathway TraG/TraD family ATPase VirD4
VSVWQDLAQVQDRYGRQATTVVNNHRGKLALAGIADLGTLDYLSRLLGDTDVDRTSVTRQAGGGQSTSTSTQQQRLAPADMLRQLPLGKAVLIYGSTPPTRLTLRRADRGTLAGGHGITESRGPDMVSSFMCGWDGL